MSRFLLFCFMIFFSKEDVRDFFEYFTLRVNLIFTTKANVNKLKVFSSKCHFSDYDISKKEKG